jgi:hypothetical protein
MSLATYEHGLHPRRARSTALPLLVAMLVALFLCVPDQIREIYRLQVSALKPENQSLLQPAYALFALLVLSFFLWRIARELAGAPTRTGSDLWSRTARAWIPRLVATLPLAGMAVGLLLAAKISPPLDDLPAVFEQLAPILRGLTQGLLRAAALCAGLAVAVFAVVTSFERYAARSSTTDRFEPRLLNWWPLYIGALVLMTIASTVLGSTAFVHVGVIPLLVLWVVPVVGILANMWRVSTAARWSMIVVLTLFFLGLDYQGWNDNHAFRQLQGAPDRPAVSAAFDKWLASRKDLPGYRNANAPYPVYVIAAEGGGLYAAYRVGKFLARLQDVCPNFAQHVFAISSVSGGSLGAAMFAMLAKDGAANGDYKPCDFSVPSGIFEKKMDRMLDRDFLSPVVSAGLFPDFAQRLIPFPIPQFDRARALEASFEEAWRQVTGNDQFAQSFLNSCGPQGAACMEGAMPSLALNLTQVDSGMQLVLSPFDYGNVGPPESGKIYDAFGASGTVDLPVSTAVGLSARFPWITPSGWFRVKHPSGANLTYRFADGGYSEGSGAGTGYKIAQYIAERIKKQANPVNAVVHLVMLTATSPPLERFWMDADSDRYGEFALPFVALSSARRGQSYTTVFDIASAATDKLKISQARVYDAVIPLAIGWQIAPLTREYIDLYGGNPQRCKHLPPNVDSHWKLASTYVDDADCLASALADELSLGAVVGRMNSLR